MLKNYLQVSQPIASWRSNQKIYFNFLTGQPFGFVFLQYLRQKYECAFFDNIKGGEVG